MLRGNIELVDLREVVGWAQDDAQPDAPVSLLITDNDQLIGRILANRYRRDLEEAGIGSGRHGFELKFEKGLAPLEKHVLRVCREYDGIDLAQSPITIEPTQTFDAAVQKTLAELVRRSGSSEQDLVAKVDFLASPRRSSYCNNSPNTTASVFYETIINSCCNGGDEEGPA